MLNGYKPYVTGDLMKALLDTGHGDRIAIVDGNFGARSHAKRKGQLVEVPSDDVVEVLEAVLDHGFPLDPAVYANELIVESIGRDFETDRAKEITRLLLDMICREPDVLSEHIGQLEPERFRRAAEKAYAIVATKDPRHFGCVILTKGVLPDPTQ